MERPPPAVLGRFSQSNLARGARAPPGQAVRGLVICLPSPLSLSASDGLPKILQDWAAVSSLTHQNRGGALQQASARGKGRKASGPVAPFQWDTRSRPRPLAEGNERLG